MTLKHASGTAQALYRAFILPSLTIKPRLPAPKAPTDPSPTLSRPFTSTAIHHAKDRQPEVRTQKWNEEITSRYVYLVDPATERRDDTPHPRNEVLRSFDHRTHRLVQFGPDERGNPNFIPVCRIFSIDEMRKAEQRRKRAAKEHKKTFGKEQTVKTLELNWAMDPNDLRHRLDRVKEFLGEGRRVEFILAAKKRGRKATREECETVMNRIHEAIAEVEKAQISRKLEGELGGFATMMVQGKVLPSEAAAKSTVDK